MARIIGGFGRLEAGSLRLFLARDVTAVEALLWLSSPSSVPLVVYFVVGFGDFIVRVEVLMEEFVGMRRRTDQLGRPLAHREIEDDGFVGVRGDFRAHDSNLNHRMGASGLDQANWQLG